MALPAWLTNLWAAPAMQMLAWAFVSGFIGFLVGLGEIVGAFRNETGRALRTGGAWLLIFLNFAASAAIYLLAVNTLAVTNNWSLAIIVGLSWPVVVRNLTFKLAQPLLPDDEHPGAAVRVEQAYASVQALARQLINTALARQRMKLVARATELEMEGLEKSARLAVISSPLPAGEGGPPEAYIDEVINSDAEPYIKKALLAAFILEHFDRQMLVDLLKGKQVK